MNIKEEADKIIEFIYKHNPGIPVEVLLSAMVQDGIRKGISLTLEEGKRWCEKESEHHFIDADEGDPKIKRGALGNSGNTVINHLTKVFEK